MPALPIAKLLRSSIAAASDGNWRFLRTTCARCVCGAQSATFSTSPVSWKRDNNRNRGVSAVRGTGPRRRQTLSVREKDYANQKLPTPVPFEREATGTPDHGLWDFFKDKKLLQTPLQESQHGRAWTVGELRDRDWESLHQLWWICVKERNRLATEKIERNRLDAGYGDFENRKRDMVVQKTMKAILDTLAERHNAYTDAYALAQRDPNIDLTRTDGPQYSQPAYDAMEPEELGEPVEAIEEPTQASTMDERPKEKLAAT